MDKSGMTKDWVACYKRKKELEEPLDKEILKECSQVHYRHLDMDSLLCDYAGRLDDFIDFISRHWGWSIEKVQEDGACKLYIDEKKDFCVCPLVTENVYISAGLCECSRAFNKTMFEKVIGSDVLVSLGNTYIRDKKSCEYIISYSEEV